MENNELQQKGTIHISDNVVAIVAGLAATEVDGVTAMSGGIARGIAERLGKNNLTRGIEVEVGETEARIDIFIIVGFGSRIPDVAYRVQEKVKSEVEQITGLHVIDVNVHVQGVE